MYDIVRKSIYLDVEYQVIQVLNDDMILVVKVEDYEKKAFPLPVFVIPDAEYVQMKSNN